MVKTNKRYRYENTCGPYLKYCENIGNRGLTAVTIIETSHMAMHVWDEDNPALIQLDVYSCKDLDEEIVFSYLYKFYASQNEL